MRKLLLNSALVLGLLIVTCNLVVSTLSMKRLADLHRSVKACSGKPGQAQSTPQAGAEEVDSRIYSHEGLVLEGPQFSTRIVKKLVLPVADIQRIFGFSEEEGQWLARTIEVWDKLSQAEREHAIHRISELIKRHYDRLQRKPVVSPEDLVRP